LGFTVNEVVHDDHVFGGCLHDSITTGDPHQKDALASIETDPEE
jgi:hypothetical protein